jgi:hypothetical protein
LSPHRWLWLVASALSLPVQVAAQADVAQPAKVERQAADSPFRQGVLLGTFGNWEIRKGLIDNTYLLIGESSPGGGTSGCTATRTT